MRNVKQIIFAVVVLLSMILTPLTALPIEAATSGTGYTKASDVQYVTSGSYIANWGARDEDCVFLSKYAVSFYAQNSSYSYDYLSSLAGGSSQSNAPSSALYQALKSMMSAEHTHKTSYDETRNQYKYTDCEENNTSKISTFYTGKEVSSAWDGGSTWNREHCWPKSKSQNGKSSDAMTDIMMLRPANASTNSSRGNKAYGESDGTSYYDPNSLGQDVRGDAARIVLYEYVRWGETSYMWGSSGVMESLNVLLKWMQEDPVDTWEMGRNDAVEAITGTRNVFVDYPEFAWLLFGQSAPKTYVTPSGEASDGTAVPGTGSGTVTPDPDPTPTPEDPTPNSTLTIAEALALGESYAHNTTTSGKYYVSGVVESIANTTYGNMTIKDASGNSIYIYGTYDATGANRFDAMANKPAVGDTITVYGVVGNYNGPQMKNAWITSITAGSGSVTPNPNPNPDPTPTPSGSASIDFSVAGNRESWDASSQVWKSNGITVTNEKGASTSNVADYTAPARFYKNSTLIVSYSGMTAIVFHVNSGKPVADFTASLDAAGATYTVNGSAVTVTFASAVNEFSVVLSAGQVRLDSLEVVGGGSGSVTPDPDPDPDPDPTPTPGGGSNASISFADVANRVSQDANSQIWQQNGIVVTNEKGASTTNVADYSNPARFYKNSTLTIAYTGMTEIVFNCNTAEHAGYLQTVLQDAGHTVSINGKVVSVTFTTPTDSISVVLSAGQVRVDSIDIVAVSGDPDAHVHSWGAWTETKAPTLEAAGEESRTCSGCGETQTREVAKLTPADPTPDTTLTIEEAIALGSSKEHNTYTSGKYYVVGEIVEVYNAEYGNMRIKDSNGNILTIYGTYSADGETRYDAMSVKPVAGDTVKIYGIVGQYNGTPQVKNGWIVEHTSAGGGTTPDPTPDTDPIPDTTLTIEEAIALGSSKEHNTYTSGKYYVVGEITEVYNTQYGNMKIKDANGNILTIYGTYSADGETRYDAMENAPQVGDTVKIYGIVGQYNGTPQVKNGWIVEHTPAGGDTPHTHEWSAWTTTKEATCKEAGEKTRTCTCGETETEAIPVTNDHSWGAWVETKAPTTEAAGEETRTCGTCGKTQTREVAQLVPGDCEHEWSDWVETKAPTTEAKGEETRTCTKCGETQTSEIPMLEHTHTFGEWTTTKEATCKEAGEKTRSCVCGETETDTIPVSTTHTWGEWTQTKAPTLEEAGEESHTCSVCQKTETREVAKLEPCDHSWGDWTVTKAPTTEEAGEVTHTCTKCGETETREVAPLTPDAPQEPENPDSGCGAPSVSNAAMIALAAACFFIFRKRLFAR